MNDYFLEAVGLDKYVGSWTLNPLDSSVTFRSSSVWGLVRVKGRFALLEGEGRIRSDGNARGRFILRAASLNTKHARRDARLRSPDFFSTDKFPTIVFDLRAIEVTALPGSVRLDGTLTIVGKSLPMVVGAQIIGEDDAGLTLHAFGSVDQSRWGVGLKRLFGPTSDTRFEVSVRLIRTEQLFS